VKKKGIIAVLGCLLLALGGAGTGFWYWHAAKPSRAELAIDAGSDSRPEKPGTAARNSVALVRQLSQAQDRIARGDTAALEHQNMLIHDIAENFDNLTPADWKNRKNVQAMMAYVLSGGRTEVVEQFLKTGSPDKEQEVLARGAMSFALRRPKTALKHIGNLEPRSLEHPVASVVALALASLHAASDATRAVTLYDEARLQSPATAIEEAALRREAPLLIGTGDTQRASVLISRYVRVFGKSLFAGSFYDEVAMKFAALDEKSSLIMLAALNASLGDGQRKSQSALLLSTCRAALTAGKLALAAAAADAIALDLDTALNAKARVCAAAALAPTESAERAVAELRSIDADRLDDNDKAIRTAATEIAKSIVDAGSQRIVPAAGIPSMRDGGSTVAPDGTAGVVKRADAALKQADLILSGVKP
jgi:chemotaxis protein MotC